MGTVEANEANAKDLLLEALRGFVDEYDTDRGTWPKDMVTLLDRGHAAIAAATNGVRLDYVRVMDEVPTWKPRMSPDEARHSVHRLPKSDLLQALRYGPQTARSPNVSRLAKPDIICQINRVLSAGGDAAMRMADAIYRARLDRDYDISMGNRRR